MARPAPVRDFAPTAQKLRVHYAKRGRLRFSSHRDFQRALERALRRAQVPMAYSVGFSPHPKISYANSAPTGVASEAEYVELGVTEPLDPDRVRAALDAALPPGLDVIEVVPATGSDFAARLEASHWLVELPGLDPADVQAAAERLLAEREVEVERLTKNGVRRFDARGPIVRLTAGAADCAILEVVVRHVSPSVRPDDVLAALQRVADLVPPAPPRVTRLAQGPLDPVAATVGDPLAPDRGASR